MAENEVQVQEDENVEVTLEEPTESTETASAEVAVSGEAASGDTSGSSDDELDNYSKSVQKRIKKLTERFRHAERDKEEATRVAKTLKEENDSLNARMAALEEGHLTEYGTRLESQLVQANAALKDAHERGDVEGISSATQALAKIAMEQERHRMAKTGIEGRQAAAVPVQQPQEQAQAQAQAQPKPNPKAQKWAEENEWFGDDEIMTQAAYVIDSQLISEGFDGTEDEYYNQLDARLAKRFPNELSPKNEGSPRVASASTSASRSTKQGRRTVKLSPSQVEIAKKLGVPLEEYAKYVRD